MREIVEGKARPVNQRSTADSEPGRNSAKKLEAIKDYDLAELDRLYKMQAKIETLNWEQSERNPKFVHRQIITQNKLSLAAEQVVRSIGALVAEYPAIVDKLEESLYWMDHPDVDFVDAIDASASGPLNIEEVMSARQKAWTVPELAKLHNLSKRGLYDHIKSGRLPSYHIGTAIRLCPATTQAWFRKCLTPPNGSR